MTNAQEIKVKQIKREMEQSWLFGENEVKRFEVEEFDTFVSVVAEAGLKGDEGTLAQVFGRMSAHIFIGKKGGLTYWTNKGKTKRLEHINLWTVHCEQNH